MKLKLFIFGAVILSSAFSVSAYSPYYTHPDLTEEIAVFFNSKSGDSDIKISINEIKWMREGAIDEDTPPRWINHFYDPVNKVGWQGKHFGDLTQEQGLYQGESMSPKPAITSIDWVVNQNYQAAYGRQHGNQTWQKAIKSYIDGDTRAAFVALGHILHLIEDASVPDHTRNDTHADLFGDPGSPYENFSKEYTNFNALTVAENAMSNDIKFFSNIQDAFEYLATYSNNNFFSEDTISNNEYALPNLKSVQKKNDYLYDGEKNIYLAKYMQDGHKIFYTLNDKSVVLPSYFSNLSTQAVLTGAGVLDLFFREVEKYRNNPESLPEIIQDSNEAALSYLKKSPRLALVNAGNFIDRTSTNTQMYAAAFSSFVGNYKSLLFAQLSGLIPASAQPQPQTVVVIQQTPALTPTPTPESTPPAADTPQQVQEPVIIAPQVVQEVVVAPVSEEKTGGEEMQAPVDNVVVAPVPDIISPPVPVFRGSGSVTGISPDALVAQNNPAPQSQTESADTGPFSTSTEEVFLEETATTTDSTATSTEEVIDNTATTTDPVITDATSTEPVLPVPPTPITDFKDSIVINEVAWMGTKAQANDEWIELYNKTDQDIDLSGWTLENKNKTFSVALAHSISARGYFLLERTASSTTDITEDMIFAGALNNSGPNANLYLKNGTTIIDSIDFSWQWPAGDNGKRYTMERVSAYATSTMAANWKTYGDPDTVPFAKDAKGDDIYGTPGRKNSVSGFYTPTENITENTTWHKEQSPYFVSTNIIVGDGATLTIEPGVVVKFAKGAPYGGGMDVRGAVIAEGSPADPIVFTSFLDDASDGIDSNRDASATSPAAGDWMSIIYTNESEVSVIRSAHIRYGGQGKNHNPNGWTPTFKGVISAQGGMLEISDSNIENNRAIAIYASNGSRPKIQRNIIHDTTQSMYAGGLPLGIGVYINTDASAEIIGNTVKNNSVGIRSDSITDALVIVKDTIFDNNIKNGEFFKGYANWNLENSGNTDTRNKGGFYIKIIVAEGQAKVLRADTMPYIVVGGITVEEGGSLEIEPGVVVKNAPVDGSQPIPIVIRGVLKSRGTEDHPIVFTSFDDDADGYDSDGSATDPVPGRWKNIVFIGSASSDSFMEYIHIRYGGQGKDICPYAYLGGPCMEYYGAMRIDGADPKITHVTLENNLAIAVFTEGFANPTIENSIIRDTKEAIKNSMAMIGGYGISIGPDSEPTITDTTYANNAEDVVYRE